MPDPTCFKCKSKFKVTQVEPGVFCCGGFCLKHYQQRKELATSKMAATKTERSPDKTDAPAVAPGYKVGDFCRGIYAEDGVEYEGKIVGITNDPDSGTDYATVQFLGYGNEETVWMTEIKPSLGEESRNKQISESGGAADQKWNIGDPVRALYSVDNLEYEGTIVEIHVDQENPTASYAVVDFVGYGNQESVFLANLLPSNGEAERAKQLAEAGVASPPVAKTVSFKVGDHVRAIFSEDQVTYEGELTTIEQDEDGRRYGTVVFYGYNNEATAWIDELLPSEGKEVRAQQAKDAAATGVVEPAPKEKAVIGETPKSWAIGDHCKAIFSEDKTCYEGELTSMEKDESGRQYGIVRFYGYKNEEMAWLDELMPSDGPEARAKQSKDAGIPEPAENTNAKEEALVTKEEISPKKKSWSIGDHCLSIFSEDMCAYEGELTTIEADENGRQYGTVKFVGYNNEDTAWLDELMPSAGKEAREQQEKDATGAKSVPESSAQGGPVVVQKGDKEEAPRSWAIGDHCRAVFSEDGLEYEGKLVSMDEADGRAYGVVQFYAYGNEDTCLLYTSPSPRDRQKSRMPSSA